MAPLESPVFPLGSPGADTEGRATSNGDTAADACAQAANARISDSSWRIRASRFRESFIPDRDDGSKRRGKWLIPIVNRERIAVWGLAAVAVCCGVPAFAKDPPKPNLSVDPIVARNFLAPVEEARGQASQYRLDPGFDSVSGQRAKLSLEVGDATLFAITGRLSRQASPSGPLNPNAARALGQRRENGKVYGAGMSRSFRGIDVSATYQYSKLTADQPMRETEAGDDGPGKSHSVRATARIRFRP